MENLTKKSKVLIFMVSSNAEKTLASVVSGIPEEVYKNGRFSVEILIIDDGSSDESFKAAVRLRRDFSKCPLLLLKNPQSQGYGGSQKLGYRYALDRGFDWVVLLHGEGQDPPEALPDLLDSCLTQDPSTDAVFGSRMKGALKGGMPLYRFLGSKILTWLQNRIVGLRLSDWRSGYRVYRSALLRRIPFERNSNDFAFDSEIIIQVHAIGGSLKEFPVQGTYGDEVCHVNVFRYARNVLLACLQFRIQGFGLLYDPKFDFEFGNSGYQEKFSFESSHSVALNALQPADKCLLVGCGPTAIVQPFIKKCGEVSVVDLHVDDALQSQCRHIVRGDLDRGALEELPTNARFDKVFALDVIEHLRSPEDFCQKLSEGAMFRGAEIILTTPNIAFLPVRLMLLVGLFNYGKRGILDLTHTRLFTFFSFKRLFIQNGLDLLEIRGIPAPIPLAFGDCWLSRLLLKMNSLLCKVMPGLFSYQIYARVKPTASVSAILADTERHSKAEGSQVSAAILT